MKKISRRDLLKALAAAAGGLSLHQLLRQTDLKALAQDQSIYLPIILKSGSTVAPPTGSRVVHTYDPEATYWNFGSSWYGDYVRQSIVDEMVSRGLRDLTGTSTVTAAWQALIPNYQPGQGIAIKVNFNNNDDNSGTCAGSGTIIDSVPQPIRSIVAGLVGMGVDQQDIWIYDAMRVIPSRFKLKITDTYPNVRFYDAHYSQPCSGNIYAGFSSDPTAAITFSQGMTTQYVTNVIVNAAHLINVPIMKHHWLGGVSLGFKHHFGTIPAPGDLHSRIEVGTSSYSSTQNPLVDIYKNTHIRNKTRLVIGDGLFGCLEGENRTPRPWSTFNDQAPNSLFFATDPVAIDCVMYDFLHAEIPVRAGSDDYLKLAQTAGLGVYERSSSHQYSQIDYLRVNL